MRNRQTGVAMAKRALCALLCAVMLLGCLVVPAEAATSYTIKYDMGNGTYYTGTVASGTTITLPNATMGDAKFQGWYKEAGFKTLVGQAGAKYKVTGNVTLYAKFSSVPKYVVTYVMPDGSKSTSTVAKGQQITLPGATLGDGKFQGWYKEASFKTLAGQKGAKYKVTGNVTFYAKFTNLTKVTIRYDFLDGDTQTPSTQYSGTVYKGQEIVLPSADWPGHRFVGWFKDKTFKTLAGKADAKYKVTGNTTLYAKWVATATVKYNSNGGSAVGSKTVDKNSTITLPTPTRSGYRFVGWYKESGLKNLAGKGGAGYKVTGNVTLYAKWQATATVKYNSNGGSAIGNRTVDKNSTITLPTPTRSGYRFVGWYTDSALKNLAGKGGASYKVAGNVTLYAKWVQQVTVSLDFHTEAGPFHKEIKVDKGGTFTLPATSPTGKPIKTWYYDGSSRVAGKGGAQIKVNSNISLDYWAGE